MYSTSTRLIEGPFEGPVDGAAPLIFQAYLNATKFQDTD